jgi:FKBP-type peptidyl-prolyl cis-trans isomerase SlyD
MPSIKDGMVAAIAYELSVGGKVVEIIPDDMAIEYLHGAENIVSGLEKALAGKQVGDTFEVTLKPAEAYGEYDEAMVEAIDIAEFGDISELEPGMELELMDEDGDWFEAVIKDITEEAVLLDFNPPMAGKTLHYRVKVIAVREATEDEEVQGFPMSLLEDYEDDGDHNHHAH